MTVPEPCRQKNVTSSVSVCRKSVSLPSHFRDGVNRPLDYGVMVAQQVLVLFD